MEIVNISLKFQENWSRNVWWKMFQFTQINFPMQFLRKLQSSEEPQSQKTKYSSYTRFIKLKLFS